MKFEKTHVDGFESALRGMRNPLNSWEKSDSVYGDVCNSDIDINWTPYWIGENDMKLAQKLVIAGAEHRKFMRMIHVSLDLTATRAVWAQLDTYHFGTKSSTSTMHKLLNNPKQITLELFDYDERESDVMLSVVCRLEKLRNEYRSMQNNPKVVDKQTKLDDLLTRAKYILPEGFLQMRTWDTNYEELRNIYFQRKNHRLKEWRELCGWIELLPYAKQLITYIGEHDEHRGND